jgi:hypothetical protein
MSKLLLTLGFSAALVSLAAGQDNRVLPPATMRGSLTAPARRGTAPTIEKSSYYPPFCPPRSCLYYAGDFETTYSGADGLFNANDEGASLEGQAWVGVKPARDVTVTGVTFVQYFASGFGGTNPTPFAVQVGIKPGQAGTMVCSTSGNATLSAYGEFDPPTYSYTVKKLSKSCKLKRGTVYYVNLLPTSESSYGYITNVPPKAPPNHHGWKNDLNDCYFNGAAFGVDYGTCDSQGPFTELSIALTGN